MIYVNVGEGVKNRLKLKRVSRAEDVMYKPDGKHNQNH